MLLTVGLLVVSVVVTVLAVRKLGADFHSASVITIWLLALDFIVRPFELVAGLDTPFPDAVFASQDTDPAGHRAQVLYIIWIAVFGGTSWLVQRIGAKRSASPGTARSTSVVSVAGALSVDSARLDETGSPDTTRWVGRELATTQPDERQAAERRNSFRMVAKRLLGRQWLPTDASVVGLIPVLAAIALLMSAIVWARFGIGDLARVVKRSSTPVPTFLRSPAVMLAYVGMALAVYGRRVNQRTWFRWGIGGFVIGAAIAFSWGARDAAMLPLVILIGEVIHHALAETDWKKRLRVVGALALIGVVGIGVGVGLRTARELVAYGEVIGRTSQGSVVRRIAVTANHTRFDALMLVFDETEPVLERPGLGIFLDSIKVALSPSDTESSGLIIPAVAVRSAVEPTVTNGWPISAPGDWFFAGGWLAVPLGAVLSGAFAGSIDRWRSTQRAHAWVVSTAFVALIATTITKGGLGVTAPVRFRSLFVLGAVIVLAWPAVSRRIAVFRERSPA